MVWTSAKRDHRRDYSPCLFEKSTGLKKNLGFELELFSALFPVIAEMDIFLFT
jgi:hypothetical protein